MKTLEQQLTNYAAYHRDARNIWTHFFGIPLIVVAVFILLARPSVDVGFVTLSPATLLMLATTIYYLRLHRMLGLVMVVLFSAALVAAAAAARQPTEVWLSWGIGAFVVGWAIQFVGHAWEGRKPAFLDDLMGLLIGPLFVTAEAMMLMGGLKTLKQHIDRHAGPVRRK